MRSSRLEIYRHRFSAVAEEMGAALMRSSFSPNIKERRDFSCAIFDAKGQMVAQAAHIPVHLGSAPMSTQAVLSAFEELHPGTHYILNDPYEGGTHLPDITLVSPVFDVQGTLRFLVANRAHHADVGGTTPGSFGLSKHIDEEGFRFGPTPLCEAFMQEIAHQSRTPQERLGDLRAQVAANLRGIRRLEHWMKSESVHVLLQASSALLDHSERMMRYALAQMPRGSATFTDILDSDGNTGGPHPLTVDCTLDENGATLDFSASCDQVQGPVNVPRAVTVSAVAYVFRCLAPPTLPTNAGYMRALKVVTRPGSILDAAYPAPVAAGNVETSQRIVDVILGALANLGADGIPAASCGSMNNLIVGSLDGDPQPFVYYETIAGGAGAHPESQGADAVHTHMTNTLNTPVESFEIHYPLTVMRYAQRNGSGGEGKYRGGDGVIRVLRAERASKVTLIGERRRSQPWGLAGGGPGRAGAHYLSKEGVEVKLADKVVFDVRPGDLIRVETPGGGGFGTPDD